MEPSAIQVTNQAVSQFRQENQLPILFISSCPLVFGSKLMQGKRKQVFPTVTKWRDISGQDIKLSDLKHAKGHIGKPPDAASCFCLVRNMT